MDELDYHVIVERFHTFQNPTSEAKLDLLIEYCGIGDGQRVLDIGCGKAWLLRRIASRFAIVGVGVELREAFLADARAAIERHPPRGTIELHQLPAKRFVGGERAFDVTLCIGASFAIGSFEELVPWLRRFVKPGGVIAIGDIYARRTPLPVESAAHFGGGAPRSLIDTVEALDSGGLTLIGLIESSLDEWDRYESLHWRASHAWARDNPDHPGRRDFLARSAADKRRHIQHDRDALGWAMFVSRVNGS